MCVLVNAERDVEGQRHRTMISAEWNQKDQKDINFLFIQLYTVLHIMKSRECFLIKNEI